MIKKYNEHRTAPLVSVGMPVYNGEKKITEAIESVLNQDFENFELIISDNASDDGTYDICQHYLKMDKRIKYFRYSTNLGIEMNFRRMMLVASGKYFTYASSNDSREKNLVSTCLSILEKDESVVICYPRSKAIDENGKVLPPLNDFIKADHETPVERFSSVLWTFNSGNIFSGLIRTDAFHQTLATSRSLYRGIGCDIAQLCYLSLFGKFIQIPEPLFIRRIISRGNVYENIYGRYETLAPLCRSEGITLPLCETAIVTLNMVKFSHLDENDKALLIHEVLKFFRNTWYGKFIQHEIQRAIQLINKGEFRQGWETSCSVKGNITEQFYISTTLTRLEQAAFIFPEFDEQIQQARAICLQKLGRKLRSELKKTGQTTDHGGQTREKDCSENPMISDVSEAPPAVEDKEKKLCLNWEYIQNLPIIRLYAGDIFHIEKYGDIIGLSLTQNDHRHIKHDVTNPLPLLDNSVDSYQAEDVFEHIEYNKLLPVINEIHRVLKPGTTFRLSVPDYGCDILINRCIKDASGNIVFDPDGGGTPQNPGHVWFPRIDKVKQLLKKSDFGKFGKVEYLHYYNMDGTFVVNKIDYFKGYIQRTPDFDERIQNPYRPMSMVIDLIKANDVSNDLQASVGLLSKTCFPKFSFIIIVLNGMPFIEYAIKAIYDFAHEIMIVEGAVEKCMFAANPDGSSKDGTVEQIRSFPDPHNRIKLIQGQWPEKVHMQNKALEYATGDYIWLVDSDEIYHKQDILSVRDLILKDRSITQLNFNGDNFWKGFDYIFVSQKFFETPAHWRRVFKFAKGAYFSTHRPPTLIWPGSDISTEQMNLIDGHQTREMGIIPCHYSYVFDGQVKQKIELYNRYGWGRVWGIDLNEWYQECFLKWLPNNRDVIEKKYPVWTGDRDSYTEKFTGRHPEVMSDYIRKYRSKHRSHGSDPVMQNVIDTLVELMNRFPDNIQAIETGTIRSYYEKHESTRHISETLGDRGQLISVGISPESIEISKNICKHSDNVTWIQSDSILYLSHLRDKKFHFAFLDSVNDKEVIFEEFKLVIPMMLENGIIMVDDAGITADGDNIDSSSEAQKSHKVWEFLRFYGIDFSILTTAGHGTQLKIVLYQGNLEKIKEHVDKYGKQQYSLPDSEKQLETDGKPKGVKIAADYDHGGTKIDTESEFSSHIQSLFKENRPKKIVETGTFLGTGTTTIIASLLHQFGIEDAAFYTIEVNPGHHRTAMTNLGNSGLLKYVTPLNGVSVPRNMLPTLEEIEEKCVKSIEFDDIFVDHQEHERALLYYRETNFDGLPDNLLGQCLENFDYRPDFVLLDSGGHIGNVEFNYLISQLKGECHIALDDIYHIKHHKSFLQIQSDPRFELLTSSKEKFGFCIAKFRPQLKAPETHIKNILWIRTDSIGDNVLASSMLPHIREKYGDAKITVVCQEHIAELYESCPLTDNILVYNKNRAYQDEQYRSNIIQQLRSVGADIALNSVYSREVLTDALTIDSGAKERIAFNGNLCNISAELRDRHNPLYSKVLPGNEEHKPEIERHRDFLKGLDIHVPRLQPIIWTTPEDESFADKFFQENNLQTEKTIALFAGAQFAVRLYSHYGTALSRVCRDNGYAVIAFGSANEQALSQQNLDATGSRTINLCGKTTIRQTAALLRRCRLGIGAEAALAHVSCAVGTPNVVLLGGGHFGRFMPYSPLTSIACLPLECYSCNWRCKYQGVHCVQGVAPEVIAEAVNQALTKQHIDKIRAFVQGNALWNPQAGQPKWKAFDQHLIQANIEITPVGDPPVTDADTLNKQGAALLKKGDTQGALNAFTKALELNPNFAGAHNNLAILYWQTSQPQKAADHFSKALQIDPNDRNTVINCTELLKFHNRIEDAKALCSSFLQRNPGDPVVTQALKRLREVEQS